MSIQSLNEIFDVGEFIWVKEKVSNISAVIEIDKNTEEFKVSIKNIEILTSDVQSKVINELNGLEKGIRELFGNRYKFYLEVKITPCDKSVLDRFDKSDNNDIVIYIVNIQDTIDNKFVTSELERAVALSIGIKSGVYMYSGRFESGKELERYVDKAFLGVYVKSILVDGNIKEVYVDNNSTDELII